MSRGTIAVVGGGAGGLLVERVLANLPPLEFFSTPAGLLLVVVACFLLLLAGVLLVVRVFGLLPRQHDFPRVMPGEPIEPPARPQRGGGRDVLQLGDGGGRDVLQLGEGRRDGT